MAEGRWLLVHLESRLELILSSVTQTTQSTSFWPQGVPVAAGQEPGFPSRMCLLLWFSFLHLVSGLQITGEDDAFALPTEQRDCSSSRWHGLIQAPGMLLPLAPLGATRAQAGHCLGGSFPWRQAHREGCFVQRLWCRERKDVPTDCKFVFFLITVQREHILI